MANIGKDKFLEGAVRIPACETQQLDKSRRRFQVLEAEFPVMQIHWTTIFDKSFPGHRVQHILKLFASETEVENT